MCRCSEQKRAGSDATCGALAVLLCTSVDLRLGCSGVERRSTAAGKRGIVAMYRRGEDPHHARIVGVVDQRLLLLC